MPKKTKIIVTCNAKDKTICEKAERIAHSYNLQFSLKQSDFDLYRLHFNDEKVSLLAQTKLQKQPIEAYVEYNKGKAKYRLIHDNTIKQPLAKAVGIKPGYRPEIIDGTAGFGYDGFFLASLGSKVTLIEQSPIIFTLLIDGIERALKGQKIVRNAANNITVIHANTIDYLKTRNQSPDTIYLDPMYPISSKSANVKKEMQILRAILDKDMQESLLLRTALDTAKKRVVVKRPLQAEEISSAIHPHFSIKMKKHRFDVYLI